ncbi:MAG: hypothetical protein NC389_17845 [Acetatifactor muris]|nr:hypothetical protein [Acetatifactor muris]
MRIGENGIGADSAVIKRTPKETERRFAGAGYAEAAPVGNSAWLTYSSRIGELEEREIRDSEEEDLQESRVRSEAEKIYEAAVSGKPNPLQSLRQAPKVPYGYLAKDGVIEYNGVCFVCDERTNSICLGDMTDEKQVLKIPLSAGGCLKVNRANLGQLSDAIGMFCPEDVNRIMRAIAQDTKVQELKNEIEDTEASVGNQLKSEEHGKGVES